MCLTYKHGTNENDEKAGENRGLGPGVGTQKKIHGRNDGYAAVAWLLSIGVASNTKFGKRLWIILVTFNCRSQSSWQSGAM